MAIAHNTNIGLAFYNDRVKEIIDAGIIAEPFTYVPITAGHMELVGGNAVVFGKIKEGYDVIESSVETELTYEDVHSNDSRIDLVAIFQQSATVIMHYFNWDSEEWKYYEVAVGAWDNTLSTRELFGVITIQIPPTIYVGSRYYVNIENEEEGIGPILVFYEALPGDIEEDIVDGLEAALLAAGVPAGEIEVGPSNRVLYIYGRSHEFQQHPIYEYGNAKLIYKDFIVYAYILVLGNTVKYPDLKCGATHNFGVVYKDRAGRVCSVIKDDDMNIYIPFYTEEPLNLLESIVKLNFKIRHNPPVDKNNVCWAETYEIVYFGNVSMDYFLQVMAWDITKLDLGSDRYSINIIQTLINTQNQNNRWKVPFYVWEAGDRLRLIGTVDAGDGTVTKYNTEGNIYDYEIEATGTQYDEEAIGGDWLIFQAVEHPVLFDGETNILVEVYRPRKGLAYTVAYGTGMVFDIGVDENGFNYHKGNIDQAFDSSGACTVPAEIDNTANDCWKYLRLNYKHDAGDIQPFWAESMFPSDWWADQDINRKLTSMGFPFLDDLSQRQTEIDERFRFGGTLIEGTRTNNIAHFTYLNYRDLQKKDGDIIGMRETGYTLNIIQMHKETSVYINRVQTFNPDGTSQFTLTDSFIADIRPLDSDYGCQHPDSIMVNGRNIYYWDNNQGAFIRSAPNGQINLAGPEYKMSRWFKDLLRWIQTSGGKQLLETRTGANNEHDEIWVTFRMGTEIRGLIFSEKKGRFISQINQITESYIHLGNFFAHLYHQRLWIMNIDEGQDYLSWSGTPTYAELEVVSNIESVRNKVFNAVAVFADHLLQSLSKYVRIPAEASGGNDLMESNIPIFDRREGVYFGEIMKDENSPGVFIDVYDKKLNGREMRGRYCFVKFKTEEHDEKVRVDSVVILSTLSERNV